MDRFKYLYPELELMLVEPSKPVEHSTIMDKYFLLNVKIDQAKERKRKKKES